MLANGGPLNSRDESPILYCKRTRKQILELKQREKAAAAAAASKLQNAFRKASSQGLRSHGLQPIEISKAKEISETSETQQIQRHVPETYQTLQINMGV